MAFITIQDWMVKDLELKGNELLTYALIYGFSQDRESEFKGSINYICEWLNTSKSTAMRTLKKLVDMGVIRKKTNTINGVVFNNYSAVLPEEGQSDMGGIKMTRGTSKKNKGSVKMTPVVSKEAEGGVKMTRGWCQNDTEGGVKMTPHNIIYNINDNIKDNIVCEEHTKKDSDSSGKKFKPPTVEEVRRYCLERGNGIDAEYFVNFYQSKNWMVGKNKMKDWKACVRTWEIKNKQMQTHQVGQGNKFHNFEQRDYDYAALQDKLTCGGRQTIGEQVWQE